MTDDLRSFGAQGAATLSPYGKVRGQATPRTGDHEGRPYGEL